MTLLISNDNIQDAMHRGALTQLGIIDAVEGAYQALAAGKAAYAPRRGVSAPVPEDRRHAGFEHEHFVFGTMEGVVQTSGYFAIRLKLDVGYTLVDSATGAKTHEKYCMEPGRYCGLILLVDAATAEPLAILNDGVVQHLRVAATSALAARSMARQDARVLGIFGSGGMARSHAAMMAAVRPLEQIKAYSPTRAHREQFASEMEEELGIPVRAVDRPELLPGECDLITACTDCSIPVVLPSFIRSGMYLSSVTGNEIDDAAAAAIDAVVLHQSIASSTILTYPAGEGRVAPDGDVERTVHPPNDVYSRGTKVRGTLAQLVSGQIPGRLNDEETNYFYNNIGSGIQFAAVAGEAYQAVRPLGTAREIPTDWLAQTIRG